MPVPSQPVRVTLIVNTTASSVTPRARVVIQKALSADHQVEVVETARRGHAARIARGAARAGAEVVVVMAGDGTLNEAADGLAGTDTALAPLPGGSTNVYARTLRIPDDPVEATGQLLASLAARSFHRIGLGVVNGRRFLFHTGIGFDAEVVEQVERRSFLKRHLAHPLFVYSAFSTWLRGFDHDHPHFDIEIPEADGQQAEVIEGCYLAIVQKTDPYTYLGSRPLSISSTTTIDTPLSVTAFRSFRIGEVIPAAGSALWKGRYLRSHPMIDQRAGLSEFTVRAYATVAHQVDGDHLGDGSEFRFAYEPDAMTLVLPTR